MFLYDPLGTKRLPTSMLVSQGAQQNHAKSPYPREFDRHQVGQGILVP